MDASLIRKERRDLLLRVDTNPPDDWRGNADVWHGLSENKKESKVTWSHDGTGHRRGAVKAGSFKILPAREVFFAAGLEKPKGLPWDLTVRRQPME